MAKVFVEDNELTDIAEAIREKNGTEETYKPSEMGSDIRAIESGGVNPFEYMPKLSSAFRNVNFDVEEIDILFGKNIDKSSEYDILSNAFYGSKGLKTLKIDTKMIFTSAQNATNAFGTRYGEGTLEKIEAPIFSRMKFTRLNYSFQNQNALKEVVGCIDFSSCTACMSTFNNCNSLETIRFAENSINISIAFPQSNLLSNESIQSIIDGVATVETTQTLTLHTDVVVKLTEAQIAQISAKNWNLG